MAGRGLEALVRKERLELSRPFGHWILSPARLPIPPLSPGPRLQAPPVRLQTPGTPKGSDRRRHVDGFRYDRRACSPAPDSAPTKSSPRWVPAGWARSTGLVTPASIATSPSKCCRPRLPLARTGWRGSRTVNVLDFGLAKAMDSHSATPSSDPAHSPLKDAV